MADDKLIQEENKLETVQSVDRAFMVLETVARRGNMSLNDLHKELGLNKPSLLRLAYTLVQNGYLDFSSRLGTYSLTLKAYEVGTSSLKNLDKISLINSTLMTLSGELGNVAQFSVEDNNQIVCLQSIGEQVPLFSMYTSVGRRSPMYSTSAGKAILSTYSNGQIIEKWQKMNPHALTEHTHTDIQSLLLDISEVRSRNYALDRQENEYNVYCVGAVVMGHTNTPVGAISISGNNFTEKDEVHIAKHLIPAVKSLSSLLGYVMK